MSAILTVTDRERDLAERLRVAEKRLHEVATACATAEQQRDEMAAQVKVMLDALLKLCESADDSDGCQYGTLSTHFVRDICAEALALPNTAAAILRQRDARTTANALRDYVKTIPGGSIIDPQWIADDIRRTADELERKNG